MNHIRKNPKKLNRNTADSIIITENDNLKIFIRKSEFCSAWGIFNIYMICTN